MSDETPSRFRPFRDEPSGAFEVWSNGRRVPMPWAVIAAMLAAGSGAAGQAGFDFFGVEARAALAEERVAKAEMRMRYELQLMRCGCEPVSISTDDE